MRCYIGCIIFNLKDDEEVFYKEIKSEIKVETIIEEVQTNTTIKNIIRTNRKTVEDIIEYLNNNY